MCWERVTVERNWNLGLEQINFAVGWVRESDDSYAVTNVIIPNPLSFWFGFWRARRRAFKVITTSVKSGEDNRAVIAFLKRKEKELQYATKIKAEKSSSAPEDTI